MTGMNTEWALEQLDDFISATATHHVPPPSGIISPGSYRTAVADEEIVKKSQVVGEILNRIMPRWRMHHDIALLSLKRSRWAAHREAAIRVREQLLRETEVRENLGDDAPEISAANLHPWVWSGASSLWKSGHFRSAVEDAAKKVNAETQNKVGRRDVSETKLFQEAFSDKSPEPGKARLRRMTPDGSDTYRSVQRGAMALAEGIYAGIRNPFNHEDPQDIDEQVALEYLAALSVLARWVDESLTETVP